MRYGNFILLVISLLLVVREAFATATVNNAAKQDNEHWWYPFLAVTEFLVVVLFSTPGLVPRQDEVPEYSLTDTSALHTIPPYATNTPYATGPQYETNNTPYATDPRYETHNTPYATDPRYETNNTPYATDPRYETHNTPYATNTPYDTPPFAASHAAPIRYGA